MIWALSEVGIALLVNVGQDVVLVLFPARHVQIHSVEKSYQRCTKAFSDQWFLKHPCEKISRGQMILQGLLSTEMSGCWDVDFVLRLSIKVARSIAWLLRIRG